MKVVFMGTPEFAVPSLDALVAAKHEVMAVVTQPDKPKGRGREPKPSPVKIAAQNHGIRVLQPQKVREPAFLNEIQTLKPDLIITAAFGQILPQSLLDIPLIMPINVHGSLLPKYQGAAPIQWALMNGETQTGITIMRMDAGMDTGPILLQHSLDIAPDETFGELYVRMAKLGADCLIEALDLLADGHLKEIPQPAEGVSFAPPISSEMAWLDWTQPPERLFNLIRALDPKPGACTSFDNIVIRLFKPMIVGNPSAVAQAPGTVLASDERGLLVACGNDGQHAILIREILAPGKRRMKVADYLRGNPIPVGAIFVNSHDKKHSNSSE